MTKKPSLYVVERKEVIILVFLFILTTILSFTVGVKYGENFGKRTAKEKERVEAELNESKSVTGGHLGEETKAKEASKEPEKNAHEETPKETTEPKHVDSKEKQTNASLHDSHEGSEAKSGHAENSENPKLKEKVVETAKSPDTEVVKQLPVAKSNTPETDEYLLNALKEAGLENNKNNSESRNPVSQSTSKPESAGGVNELTGEEGELPQEVKTRPSAVKSAGTYTIQVGSYPTEQDAKQHLERLREQKLEPFLVQGVDSQNGKWYRVALGKYPDKEKAASIAKTYKSKGLIDNFFVRKIH